MIRDLIRRLTVGLLAAAVLATGASVVVVALAFALYALVTPYVGRAGGAAVVAAAAALLIAAIAGILFLATAPGRAKTPPPWRGASASGP